jgi:hypothetical protein
MAIKTADDWRDECNYISGIADRCTMPASAFERRVALRNFNGDRACFVRYCEMQRDDAERNGFYDAATYIQECINDLT